MFYWHGWKCASLTCLWAGPPLQRPQLQEQPWHFPGLLVLPLHLKHISTHWLMYVHIVCVCVCVGEVMTCAPSNDYWHTTHLTRSLFIILYSYKTASINPNASPIRPKIRLTNTPSCHVISLHSKVSKGGDWSKAHKCSFLYFHRVLVMKEGGQKSVGLFLEAASIFSTDHFILCSPRPHLEYNILLSIMRTFLIFYKTIVHVYMLVWRDPIFDHFGHQLG